jgi:hypothetical protein
MDAKTRAARLARRGLLFAYGTSAGHAQLRDAYINSVGYDTSCGQYIAAAHNSLMTTPATWIGCRDLSPG